MKFEVNDKNRFQLLNISGQPMIEAISLDNFGSSLD